MHPKVTIIILNWNGKEDTIECLESLKQTTYSNYEILLVDNGSIDGSVEYFKKYYPKIHIIENWKNLGFAEGCNVGIRKAIEEGTDYVLLLNNDTIVESDFLDKMISLAESKKNIGIVGPKICYYDQKNKIARAGEKINLVTGKVRIYERNREVIGDNKKNKKVELVEGSCFLIKSRLFHEVGLLDSDYFAYAEDIDYCLRASRKNFEIYCSGSAIIYHKGSRSSSSYLRMYLLLRNLTLLINKNTSKFNQILYSIYYLCMIIPRFAFYTYQLRDARKSINILYYSTKWNIRRVFTGNIEDRFFQQLINND